MMKEGPSVHEGHHRRRSSGNGLAKNSNRLKSFCRHAASLSNYAYCYHVRMVLKVRFTLDMSVWQATTLLLQAPHGPEPCPADTSALLRLSPRYRKFQFTCSINFQGRYVHVDNGVGVVQMASLSARLMEQVDVAVLESLSRRKYPVMLASHRSAASFFCHTFAS